MLFSSEYENLCAKISNHPNPFFQRECFLLLDGEWDFSFEKEMRCPYSYSRKIIVPYAPESKASGIGERVPNNHFLCYRKEIVPSKEFIGYPAYLHFLGVDQIADIYWDGIKIYHHEGGYSPFCVYLPILGRRNTLEVVVKDDVSDPRFVRGKQSKKSGGIRYRETSGIWRSVYLERLPNGPYIKKLRLLPSYENRLLTVVVDSDEPEEGYAECFFEGRKVAEGKLDDNNMVTFSLRYDFYPWSLKHPSYYQIVVHYGQDKVTTYSIFRKIEKREIHGTSLLYWNEKPQFLSLLLDQGYHGEAGYTSTKESIVQDLLFVKRAGFCGVRLHQKIEQPLYYYVAMILGLAIFQDIPQGGEKPSLLWVEPLGLLGFDATDVANHHLGRKEASGRAFFERELQQFLNDFSLYGSIVEISLFNEGWGQFDTERLTHEVKKKVSNIFIESASGWFDKKSGDIRGYHHYYYYPKLKKDSSRLLGETEFGGVSYFHLGSRLYRLAFSKAGFIRQFKKVMKKMGMYIERYGLSLCVYTQLADVEQEQNGLLDEKRMNCRLPLETLKEENRILLKKYEQFVRQQGDENGY